MTTNGKLFDVLQAMNWSYGRGRVIGYDAGVVIRAIPITQCASFKETRRFMFVGDRVRYLGHTRKIT